MTLVQKTVQKTVTDSDVKKCEELAEQALGFRKSFVSCDGYRIFSGQISYLDTHYDAVLLEEGIPENRKYLTFPKYHTEKPKAISILIPALIPNHIFGQTPIPTHIEYYIAVRFKEGSSMDTYREEIQKLLNNELISPPINVLDEEVYQTVLELNKALN